MLVTGLVPALPLASYEPWAILSTGKIRTDLRTHLVRLRLGGTGMLGRQPCGAPHQSLRQQRPGPLETHAERRLLLLHYLLIGFFYQERGKRGKKTLGSNGLLTTQGDTPICIKYPHPDHANCDVKPRVGSDSPTASNLAKWPFNLPRCRPASGMLFKDR